MRLIYTYPEGTGHHTMSFLNHTLLGIIKYEHKGMYFKALDLYCFEIEDNDL